jgi:hypothetical protein
MPIMELLGVIRKRWMSNEMLSATRTIKGFATSHTFALEQKKDILMHDYLIQPR